MTDQLVLDLVGKGLLTDQIVLTVGYDVDNLNTETGKEIYQGEISTDRYGRKIPKHAHGTANLKGHTSSTKEIMQAVCELFDRIVDQKLLARRITVSACHLLSEAEANRAKPYEQLDVFSVLEENTSLEKEQDRERALQNAMLSIKRKYGKNAILKGMNLEEGATAKDRNGQIGGHKA